MAAAVVGSGLALLGPVSGPAASADSKDTAKAPLRVSIRTLTPSTMPQRGGQRINVTGTVTNTSDESWSTLQVFLVTSSSPITHADDLETASRTDPHTVIGTRLSSPGLYDEVGDLAPGESTTYSLSVRRRDLQVSGDPGVYWMAVHVLGTSQDGLRDNVADGRARTFMPLVGKHPPTTRLALVLRIEEQVHRSRTGQLLDVRRWRHTLRADGRLSRLVNLSATADQPLTWVLDPAVVAAAESMSEGNPPLAEEVVGGSATATPSPGSSSSGSPSPSPEPTPGASSTPTPAGSGSPRPTPAERHAVTWLAALRSQAPSHTVLSLPYGDLDVAAVLGSERFRGLYDRAVKLSEATITNAGMSADPVVAPDDGHLPAAALRRIDATVSVLLADSAFPDAAEPVVRTAAGASAVLSDTGAGSGGPAPIRAHDPLAMRQRILSEAALHAMSPQAEAPLVVSTPPFWDPGRDWSAADFFGGLAVPWLQMIDLPSAASSAATSGPGHVGGGTSVEQAPAPAYSKADRRRQLPVANLRASRELIHTAAVYSGLITGPDHAADTLNGTALLASSQYVRAHPRRALARVDNTSRYVENRMREVRIDGPPFVMMSSQNGPIQITLVNGLDRAVTVGVEPETITPGMKITVPDPVDIGPGRRASVRLKASSSQIGVHAVTLAATNANGKKIGSFAHFNVRTSQVGTLIWVIMGVGGAVLLVAISIRLWRRWRNFRASSRRRLVEGHDS